MCHQMLTYKYQPCVKEYMQEQQEATDSLMQEMEKDSLGSFKHSDLDISQDSTSCDNDSSTATIHGNLTSSTSHQHNCTYSHIHMHAVYYLNSIRRLLFCQ